MNLTNEIQKRVDSLTRDDAQDGIRAAVKHIKIAEKRYGYGKNKQDEDFFNDAIYRCNQAFEGMLKEAYQVIEEERDHHISIFDIENHLLENQVYTQRVVELFKSYRKNWRNPSTHNHRLLFNEQEALLAIISVYSFTAVLLDLILERISFKNEKERIKAEIDDIKKLQNDIDGLDLYHQIIYLIQKFGKRKFYINDEREVEYIGRLTSFINSVEPSITFQRDVQLEESSYRPDIVFFRKSENVIVEIKSHYSPKLFPDIEKNQLITSLKWSEIDYGILYMPKTNSSDLNISSHTIEYENRIIHYTIISTLSPSVKVAPASTMISD